jgi:hypothetical protein
MGLEIDLARTKMPEGNYFAPENTDIYFVRVGDGQTRIEVLIPRDALSGIGRRLQKMGPASTTLAMARMTPQVHAKILRERGLEQIDLTSGGRGDLPGSQTPFFYPRSAGGILTEIVPLRD